MRVQAKTATRGRFRPAYAFSRDPEFGRTLFARAFQKVIVDYPANQPGDPAIYSDFAFYYSRIDPGYSRLLLENQFEKDVVHSAPTDQESGNVKNDIIAMGAIDPNRAEEMGASDKNPETGFEAGLKAAQYLALPQQFRDALPFWDWSWDENWIPTLSANNGLAVPGQNW